MSTTSITLGRVRPKGFRGYARTIRTRPALTLAVAVAIVAWAGLVVVHHQRGLVVSRAQAVVAVERDPRTGPMLQKVHWTRSQAIAVDSQYETVWFYDGPRLVFAAVVTRQGQVAYEADPSIQKFAYGSNIANDPRMLALLSVVFALMCAVWPLWRLRNLDVLVASASTGAIVLLNDGLLGPMVALGSLVLLYFVLRCGWWALGDPRPAKPFTPLYDRLTAGWSDGQRLRIMRLLAVAAALAVAMIGVSSLGVVDVGRAVMEGATDIVHGMLPYGHVPFVLHGDTYPIGSYLFYVPLALLTPVHDGWDTLDATLWVAVIAVLIGGAMVWRSARSRPAGDGAATAGARRSEAERLAALRALVAWLTFPALVVSVSTGTTDVVLGVALLGAVLLWRRSYSLATLLSAAAWFKLMPVALIPLVLAPLRGRRLLLALLCIAFVSGVMTASLLALGGVGAIGKMVHAIGYQFGRASPNSVWAFIGSVPLQQLVQAATLALIVAATIRMARDQELMNDRGRIAALCAAVILGLELSSSYWTYLYMDWVLPFLALSLLHQGDGRHRR